MVHISLRGIHFSYPVFSVKARSLKLAMVDWFAGAAVDDVEGRAWVHAISDLSLEARPGDRVGLIGRNGSGKSTILRVLAGLAHPQKGEVDVEGRVVSQIERGLGVNLELSGARNIELPLRLLGATNAEVRAALAEIPEWTGLGPFIDMPVRTYSDGMKARLMFAISTSIHADILLLDEWLGMGDADFMIRAEQRIAEMLDRTAIVVLASHSVDILRRLCTRVCWMERGRLIQIGPPAEVIEAYLGQVSGVAPTLEKAVG